MCDVVIWKCQKQKEVANELLRYLIDLRKLNWRRNLVESIDKKLIKKKVFKNLNIRENQSNI